MIETITTEAIREVVQRTKMTFYSPRSCSICGVPIGWVFRGDDVFFQSGCGCTRREVPDTIQSYEELAEHFNMQTPEWRARLWSKFIGEEKP